MQKHYEMGYFGVVPLTQANQTPTALQRLNEMLVASNVARINSVYTSGSQTFSGGGPLA